MTEKIQINLRIDEKTLKKLDEQAKKEGRPRNNLIEFIIKNYLEKNGKIW